MEKLDPVGGAGSGALWERVRQSLAEQVADGILAPGSRLPSERELSEQLAVSRVTVRRALLALEDDGIVETSPGLGRFVRRSPQVEEPPNQLVSLTRMGASLGVAVTSRVLVARVRPSTLDEAEALGLGFGADVVELERLRLFDDVPIVIDHSLVPAARAPGLLEADFAHASLYEELSRRCGLVAWRADYALQADPADARSAELLGLSIGDPVLVARQTTVDPEQRIIQLSVLVYRGDRYRFRTTLQMGTSS